MFADYFLDQSRQLQGALHERLEKRGVQLPSKQKDVRIYKELYDFFKDHLPGGFSYAVGKIRNRKHLLNKSCDLLIFKKWCKKFFEMTGGYVLADQLHCFVTIETDLNTAQVLNHAALTEAVKTMYAADRELDENAIVPVYSVLFSYRSSIPLLSHRVALEDASREKDIPITRETDMIVVMDQGLILKDWENGGVYRGIETGEDTLMWFYILLLEYLDRDGSLGFDPRSYVKMQKEYREY